MTMKMTILFFLGVSLGFAKAAAGFPDSLESPGEPRFKVALVDSLSALPTLAEYSGFALRHNPELASQRAAWQAAAARGDVAGALPDPRFTWSEAIEPVETRLGPQQRILAVTQQIPWFGTLGLRRGIEDERSRMAAARWEAAGLAVLKELRTAFFELAYLERGIGTAQDHLDLLVQWEKSARSRYETGAGPFAAVVKSQVEIGSLENRMEALRGRRRPLTARFNAALGRVSDAPVHLESDWPDPGPLDREDLQTRMRNLNPDLILLDHQAAGDLKARRLAGKNRYPGLSLGFNYIQIGPARMDGVAGSGQDAMMATVGLSLPLWRGAYAAAEKEAEGRYRASEHQKADLANRLSTRLEQYVFEYEDARRRSTLYRDTLLPKARQALAAVRSAYETGEAGYLDLIDSERVLLEFELAAHRAATDLVIGLASIDAVVGGGLYDSAGILPGPKEE
jgi:outer membrane protein TolC